MPNVDRTADAAFTDAVSRFYERVLVPLIFEEYAAALAERVAARSVSRVLEIAAGTGVVTRALASRLPPSVEIIATDLNQTMLDQAAAVGTSRPVEWRQANALALPFENASFDVVVCQYGVMFFPDRPKAFSEVRRVLRDGGVFLFNVWDRIEENEFADVITTSLEAVFPDDPPRFLARTPHGYFDPALIARDLAAGGFTNAPDITTVAGRSRARSPDIPAIAYCHGTVLREEIEARDRFGLERATAIAAAAIAKRFGTGAVDGKIQALIVMVAP